MLLKSNTNISDFFAAFPLVYCLSLPSCEKRRHYMAGLFAEHGVEHYLFFDAFNGDSEAVRNLYKEGKVKAFPSCFRCGKLECGNSECNNTLIPAQVATFLSYIELFKRFIASGHSFALFVEDDIKLVDAAEQLCGSAIEGAWQEVTNLTSKQPVLVQLGWALCCDHSLIQPVEVKPSLGKMSNPAFALNRAMAKKIVDSFECVATTIDIFIHRQVAKQASAYTFFPPLFYEMSWSTGEVDSLIHPKTIRVDYLNKVAADPQHILDAKALVSRHKKHTSVYPIVVMGHPRCGSGYAAKLLNAYGLEIGHEKLLRDGISSWMFSVEDKYPWAGNDGAKTREFKYFKHLIHHVRDPRTAISSIIRDSQRAPTSFQFRRKHILKVFGLDINDLDDDFQKAVASYVYWNKLVLMQSPSLTFRVEDQEKQLYSYLAESNGFNLKNSIVYPDKSVNSNKAYQGQYYDKPIIDENEFSNLPDALLGELNRLCVLFGYQEFKVAETFDKNKFLRMLEVSTLEPTGWLRSARENVSLDNQGNPQPWWTLPATEFIHGVLSKHWRVFEYGCGHSTLWWAERVAQVIGVDHDKDWFTNVMPRIESPHRVYLSEQGREPSKSAVAQAQVYLTREVRGEFGYDEGKMTRRGLNDIDFIAYADTINQVGGKFDCIVIDGMARRLCAEFAISRLNENGIIIFDNSNRSDYFEGYQTLVEAGFYQLRFSGPVAGAVFPSCTSIFIKSLDSLPKIVFEPSIFGIKEY